MAKDSNIEWTEATWNPWHGCHKISAGCKNCYMFRDKAKYGQDPNVVLRSKTKFYDPLKWTEPTTIFTCSWSDFFIEEADEWRDEAFAIMALTPHHTYQVLTKRPDRMLAYLNAPDIAARIALKMGQIGGQRAIKKQDIHALVQQGITVSEFDEKNFFLPNVWLGVSVEDQKTARERIPLLLKTPAAVRWISAEPLLGLIDFTLRWGGQDERDSYGNLYWGTMPTLTGLGGNTIDWIVAGGESGPDARPMHPDWARSIRDQCQSSGVPFFFKQWGEYLYANEHVRKHENKEFLKVGKKRAGRILDGREWNEMPEVSR